MSQFVKQFNNKIISNIDLLITALLFITTPFVYSKKLLDPVLYSRYLVLSIWALLITIVLTVNFFKEKFVFSFTKSSRFIFIAAALFIVINIFSAFHAINPYEAVYKTFKEFLLLLTMFYFYQMINHNSSGKNILIKSVIIMTAGFLVIAIVQLTKSDFSKFSEATQYYGYYFRQAIWNVKSTLANWNPFAYFLFLSLPFSIYGSLFYKNFWRIFSITITLLSLVFIGILVSKGGWAVTFLFFAVIALLLYMYMFFKYTSETGKSIVLWIKVALLAAPVFVVVTGVFLLKKTDIKILKVVTDKVEQVLNPEKALNTIYSKDKPTSAQTRTLVWANTIEMMRDNPLFGVGPGQWRIVYAKYGLDGFEEAIRNGSKHFQRTHNDFLWIGGETGFTGLLLYLIIYIGILVISLKNASAKSDIKDRILNLLIFSSLTVFMVVLSISFMRERISHNMLYLLMMALVLSINKSKTKEISANKIVYSTIFIATIILLVFNIKLATDMVKGEKYARILARALKTKNSVQMIRAARNIENTYYTLDAFAVPIPFYKGVGLSKTGKIKEAKAEFEKAYKLHPYHLQVLNNLATSYDIIGDKQIALKYYKKALNISPRYKDVLVNIAIVNYNLNNFDKTLVYLARVPLKENKPKKYKKVVLATCRKKAVQLINFENQEKLQKWGKNENMVYNTFLTYKNSKNKNFGEILLNEIGKK
jgi:O-antigen ligase